MNIQSDAVPNRPLESQVVRSADIPFGRRMYWSLRRELWESRSIYIAPLAVAALFLAGFLISVIHLPNKMRAALALEPMQRHEFMEQPFNFAALLIMGTTFIVAIFYSLEALHGERRDRSILFWKSLPVSDLTTVLSKMTIPVVVLPLLTFAITGVTQLIMLLISNAVLMGNGLGSEAQSIHVSLFPMWVMLLYHLVMLHGLWYAPIYGWLMLVSAWARRAAFLWASIPLLVIGIVEKIAFNTSYFSNMLLYRFSGGAEGAAYMATGMSMDPLSLINPVQFLFSPGMLTGLAVAAVFVAGAVQLRRYQGPI
jgi:ABC-2 type transport system permease protein